MRTSLFVLTVFLSSAFVNAQFVVGAKAGFNSYWQSVVDGDEATIDTEMPKAQSGPGYHVGAFGTYELSDVLFLRSELLYNVTTTKEEENITETVLGVTTTTESEWKINLSYLQWPVLFGFHFSDRMTMHAGPALGFLLSGMLKANSTSVSSDGVSTSTSSIELEEDATEDMQRMELAGTVGLGYRTDSGLDFGFRYWRGITPLEDDTDYSKTYQNLFQFSIGYAILR